MSKQAILSIAIGACTVGILYTACSDNNKPETQESSAAATITVLPIQAQKVSDQGEWFGYLRGINSTSIRPRVSGFLLSQDYKNGAAVKEGDVLFRIDPELFEAELAQAQANLMACEATLASAQASEEQAALNLKRYEQLYTRNAVAEKDLDDARQNLSVAKATVAQAKASIEQASAAVNTAQINLDYTVVRAPFDGVVGTATTSQGDLVSPNTELANIASIDPIRVDFAINGDLLLGDLAQYGTPDKPLSSPPPVEILLENGSTFPATGEIVSVDSKTDDSGLVPIVAHIPNDMGVLRPGMPVRLRMPLKSYDALLVPKDAIRSAMRNNFILAVDKEGMPRMIPINLLGEHKVMVKEADGFTSVQTLVSVEGSLKPIADYTAALGYESPADTPIVADAENGVLAASISSKNSRITAKSEEKPRSIRTTPLSFKPQADPLIAQAVEAKQEAEAKEHGTAQSKPEAKPTKPNYLVRTAPLVRQDVYLQDEWYGTLRGEEEAIIRPRVTGFLLTQNFKNGDIVNKGDTLFTIDPEPFKASLAQARANLSVAKASKEQAQAKMEMNKLNYERFVKLEKSSPGAISDQTVTDSKTAYQMSQAAVLQADAAIAQAQAAVTQATINLGYTTVIAPFTGRVGVATPSIGDLVSPEGVPLVNLSSVDPMRVDFVVSGQLALEGFSEFSEQRQALSPTEQPKFTILLENGVEYPEKGSIVSADNALSVSRGTLALVGRLENKDGALRTGMPVRVRTAVENLKNAYLVPVRAPMSTGMADVIFVVAPDGSPSAIPITRGNSGAIPITGPDGKNTIQPIQIIDVDRNVMSGMFLAGSGCSNVEELILKGAQAENWEQLLLKKAEVASVRALMEKQAGKALPDDMPAKNKSKDWSQLLLRQAGVTNFRELVLKQAGAKDELDLIAQGQGALDLMDMLVKKMGYKDFSELPVIVEGSINAAQAFGDNKARGNTANKLRTEPYHYVSPQTVVPSVTASAASGAAAADKPAQQETPAQN